MPETLAVVPCSTTGRPASHMPMDGSTAKSSASYITTFSLFLQENENQKQRFCSSFSPHLIPKVAASILGDDPNFLFDIWYQSAYLLFYVGPNSYVDKMKDLILKADRQVECGCDYILLLHWLAIVLLLGPPAYLTLLNLHLVMFTLLSNLKGYFRQYTHLLACCLRSASRRNISPTGMINFFSFIFSF